MKNQTNRSKAEAFVAELSPVKKQLGLAILDGHTPEQAAKIVSKKNKQPLTTYKAYATMVFNDLDKVTGGRANGLGAGKRATMTKLKSEVKVKAKVQTKTKAKTKSK